MRDNNEENFVIRPSWNNYLDVLSVIVCFFYCAGYIEYAMPANLVPKFIPPILVAMGVFFLCVIVIRRYSLTYSLTDGRLICNQGLVARNESSIRLADVRAVHLNQGVFDRLMNTGNLSFSSAAQSDADIVFKGVDNPKALKEKIHYLMDRAKAAS